MLAPQARYILGSLFLVGLLAVPAGAEIQSVTFTTTNKRVAFL
jgi:hypothetical protein